MDQTTDVKQNVKKESVTFPIVHSEEEAYAMYCDYAHRTGFSVRKQHITYWTHTRVIRGREYSCSKAGLKITKKSPNKYRKLDTRTKCLACLHFTADKDGKNWTVSKFVEEHNHPLATENEQHLLRSHRHISVMQGNLIKNMTRAGIRTVDAYNFLSNEVGGVENLGFCKGDAYNFVQREKKALIESGDAVSLEKILKEKQLEDHMFSYDVRTNELNRLTSFFWMDGHSKIDYDCYGDVIIFDTTYRLNTYNLACASFVAVNCHWQSIFIGGAFIAEENIDSFCWVFDTFLKFVGGKVPKTIFTNQDRAMSVAIERVFLGTCHRLCQWHISKKAPSKVPCFNNDKSVLGLFYQCMSKCDSEFEFERYWNEMMVRGNLQENGWLIDLYACRRNWSTAYNKDVIDLGILSTQRSKSANNRLHGCSKATSSLVECFIGLEKLVSTWRRAERDENFKCKQGSVSLMYRNCILKYVSKVYTRKMFSIFEKIFMEGVVCVCVVDERYDDGNILYITNQSEGDEEIKRCVNLNPISNEVTCSCRGFETKGLLCEHILRIYNMRNANQIPTKYLLKRFTMMAKNGIYLPNTPTIAESESNSIFRNHLMRFTYDLSSRIQNCRSAKEHVMTVMNELTRQSDDLVDRDENEKKSFVDGAINKEVIRDPPTKRPKGILNAMKGKIVEKKKKTVGVEDGSQKDFNFISTPTHDHQSCPPATPNFSDQNDDLVLDSSFNFSSIPDVFKP